MRRLSLSQRVTLFTTLGLGVVWAVAAAIMITVMWYEQEELFDLQLADTAHVLLPLLSAAAVDPSPDLDAPQARPGPDEALIWWLVDRQGGVLRQAETDAAADADAGAARAAAGAEPATGFSDMRDYRVYFTGFNAHGHGLQMAAPLAERREAFREGMVSFLGPMLALLPLTWLLIGWIARRAMAPMNALRAEIAARDGSRLDVIDASDWPEDLVRIAGTLNGFMARLSQALESERAFATNAAHELRTPVAIALAQVQQLRAEVTGPAQLARIGALERALQRMRQLVARLLQLARADAGIGMHPAVEHDLVALTELVLQDVVPSLDTDRIVVSLPPEPVPARIDADAYAIVMGNLVENALQHGAGGERITVALRPGAVLEVGNGGPVVADLDALPRRFRSHGGGGFGLGLHICSQIVAQAGGRLELISPRPGRRDGFMARVTLPV